LYQLLDPTVKKFYGFNIYQIIVGSFNMLYACPLSVSLFMNSINYWKHHKVDSILYFGIGIYILFTIYKAMTLIWHSDKLWELLSITRFDLTSYGERHDYPMGIYRKRSIMYTYTLTITTILASICYIISPLAFNKVLISMTNIQGSTNNYRLNAINFYTFFPAGTYNNFFSVFYTLESIYVVIVILMINMFDLFIITICVALSGQLRTISIAFASIGHDESKDHCVSRSISKYDYTLC